MSEGFHTLTAAENAVSRGIWALIVKDFSGASSRDIEMAEKALRSDPMLLSSIISSVESLQKAYAADLDVITAGVDTQTSGTVVMPVWHHEMGWVGDESKNSLATVIAAFAKSIRTGGGRGKVTIVDGDIEDIDDETMVPTSITVLPEGYGAESDSELESADRAKKVAFIDAATGNRTVVDMENYCDQGNKVVDISISINGETKTLRGTASDVDRLMKILTLTSQKG